MKQTDQITRRQFASRAVAAAATISIVPRHVIGKGQIPPSEIITKAVIGVGGMGRGHLKNVNPKAKLLAVCDVDENHLKAAQKAGGPDVKPFKDFRELDREAMLAGVTMNMITPIELIQSVIDGMVERGFGRIVNITSISVKMPIPGLDLSSAARAGLTSFLAGVVPKVAEHNVTINNILPGFFLTDRHSAALKQTMEERGMSREEAIAERAEIVPAKRFGDPAEFGEACAFLCAASAGYITGQNLLIDGGRFPGAF